MTLIRTSISTAAIVAGLILAGCNNNTEKPPETTTPPVPKATTPMPAPGVTPSATAPAMTAPESLPAATSAAAATEKATAAVGDAASASVDKAKSLLQQVTDYIKANKLDDADTTLKKVEDMKSSLPSSMQTEVDEVRASLTTAKAANSVKIPGLGGK